MNVPAMYTKFLGDARAEKLRGIVRCRLATVEQALVGQLQLLAGATFPPDAEQLGIELDMPGNGKFDPTVWCACRETLILSDSCPWTPPVPMYTSFMEPVIVHSADILNEAGIGEDEQGCFDFVEFECLQFIRDCWLKAGGEGCAIYATTQGHDSGWMLNLKSGEWESM